MSAAAPLLASREQRRHQRLHPSPASAISSWKFPMMQDVSSILHVGFIASRIMSKPSTHEQHQWIHSRKRYSRPAAAVNSATPFGMSDFCVIRSCLTCCEMSGCSACSVQCMAAAICWPCPWFDNKPGALAAVHSPNLACRSLIHSHEFCQANSWLLL